MLIRDATPGDAPAIARARVAAWQHAYEDFVDPRVLATLDLDDEQERWDARLTVPATDRDRLRVAVVEHDGRVLGFTAILPVSREPDVGPGTGELAAQYVHPVAQGAGLGARMLDHAHDALLALGAQHATLRVLATNEVARSFYAARGWTPDPQAPSDAPGGAAGPTERWQRALS